MRRSKYGYLLLALLVTTGLAGTITSTSITNKERKFVVSHLKVTRADVLGSVKDLSDAQLNFKVSPGQRSIKESIYHIAFSEKNLWNLLQHSLKQPANPDKRSEIKWTDDQLLEVLEDRNNPARAEEAFDVKHARFKSLSDALETFKSTRADHIKYIKNTTEDLRNHVVQMSFGWIDCYQLCLVISSHSNSHIQEIAEITSNTNFPSR